MAYIRLATEGKELFKLLFMRVRKGAPLAPGREMDEILPLITKNTGLSREQAQVFHLELWVFVHGMPPHDLFWEPGSPILSGRRRG